MHPVPATSSIFSLSILIFLDDSAVQEASSEDICLNEDALESSSSDEG